MSFHAYNNVNGDLALTRESLDALQQLLNKYGLGNIPKWQTEQGAMAEWHCRSAIIMIVAPSVPARGVRHKLSGRVWCDFPPDPDILRSGTLLGRCFS